MGERGEGGEDGGEGAQGYSARFNSAAIEASNGDLAGFLYLDVVACAATDHMLAHLHAARLRFTKTLFQITTPTFVFVFPSSCVRALRHPYAILIFLLVKLAISRTIGRRESARVDQITP